MVRRTKSGGKQEEAEVEVEGGHERRQKTIYETFPIFFSHSYLALCSLESWVLYWAKVTALLETPPQPCTDPCQCLSCQILNLAGLN